MVTLLIKDNYGDWKAGSWRFVLFVFPNFFLGGVNVLSENVLFFSVTVAFASSTIGLHLLKTPKSFGITNQYDF